MDLSGGPVLDSCEHGKEPCGFIKGRVYLYHLRHYNLQKDPTEWNNYLARNEAKNMYLLSLNLTVSQDAFNSYKWIITKLCMSKGLK
jgi:hypothetical protein